ncbi:store-operated calcium entry-associated regulatory factor-like [Dermatophagoides pteronyssinus]|uniref:store-operated calcium entry-associated regulatory factor-like n=1 Tax=Dermatophagoides pteronyssinus TaxID=6956 RepID=UPI003F666132
MNIHRKYLLLLLTLVMMIAMVMAQNNDRIKLKDIQTLTLYSDRWTQSRLTSPIQQLTCVGGYCNKVKIPTAQCYNRGSDGRSIQWECKAEMPSKYKFGQLDMSCEVYDSPEDEYILAGSCGLRYTIEKRSLVDGGAGHQPGGNYFGNANQMKPKSTSNESFSFIPIIIIALIIFFIYYKCLRKKSKPNQTDSHPANDANQYPFFARPTAPPAPGFRPDLFDQQSPPQQPLQQPMGHGYPNYGGGIGGGTSGGKSNFLPGLLGGAAAGGLMGYLFGASQNRTVPDYGGDNFSRPSTIDTFGNSSFDIDDGGGMIESTGFASTSER